MSIRTPSQMALLAVLLLSLLGFRWALAAGSPTPGTQPAGTPRATAVNTVVVPTVTSNAIVGTVAAISGTEITVNTSSGLETITVPQNVPVLRNNLPSSLDQVEATDKITIQMSGAKKVIGIIAIASPPPTAIVTPTGAPASPTAQPTSSTTQVTGQVSGVNGSKVIVNTDAGKVQTFDLSKSPSAQITRNGKTASAKDLKTGDDIAITLDSGGAPLSVSAVSPNADQGGGTNLRWVWYSLILLAPFLLLLLLFLGPGRVPFLVRSRR